MTNDDLHKYVHQILSHLKSNLETYEKAKEQGVAIGANPYLLIASSGINFLGSLGVPDEKLKPNEKEGKGLERKSKKGSLWYIKNYLTKVKPEYGNRGIPLFVYSALRCGQVHEGIVKGGVLIETKYKNHHLSILEIREPKIDETTKILACINTRILAEDLIKSTEFFVEDMVTFEQFSSKLAIRLSEHLETTYESSNSVDLPRYQLDDEPFDVICNFASNNPNEVRQQNSLRSRYWDEL